MAEPITVYPGVKSDGTRVSVLAQDGVTPIPNAGAVVGYSDYYQALLNAQKLLTYDPVNSGGIPIELLIPPLLVTGTPDAGDVLEATGPNSATWDPSGGWFVARAATGDVTAENRQLIQMVPSGATAVVTTPTGATDAFFGVQLCGHALGKTVEVRLPDTTLLATLDVDDESIWLAYDATGADWKISARDAPAPIYDARFSPLGTWLSTGADANISDTSGNGHTLTKGVTITPAPGAELGRLATAYPGRYANANAAFLITGALSYEYLCCFALNATTFAAAMMFGAGTGGSANNLQYQLTVVNDAGVARWAHRQQSGANVTVTLTGPMIHYGWQHVCVTRGATTKFYIDGVLAASGALAAPDGGASGQLFVGGTASNQATASFQQGSIWTTELTAAQVAYLARLRLGKFRSR